MVAHNRACHGGGHADDHDGVGLDVLRREYREDDRDQHAERTPGGTRRKREAAADRKHDAGQEANQGLCGTFQSTMNELSQAEAAGRGVERPGQREDQDGGNHGLEAVRQAIHAIPEAKDLAAEVPDDGEDDRHGGAEHEADAGGRVAERVDQAAIAVARGVEHAAGIDEADEAAGDEDEDREDEVDHLALADGGGFIAGMLFTGEQVAMLAGRDLVLLHGAEVEIQQDDRDHHGDGEQRVEVVRDALHEQFQAIRVLDVAGDRGRPGADRCDDADRGCRRVDEISELGAGDLELVGHGAHDGADRQAVEVVVDEDDAAEEHGHEARALAALDLFRAPTAECGGTARLVHQGDHRAKDDEEHEHAHVAAAGQRFTDHGGLKDVGHRADRVKVCIQ